jgi:hypothetical protein
MHAVSLTEQEGPCTAVDPAAAAPPVAGGASGAVVLQTTW